MPAPDALQYVNDGQLGWRRVRRGRGFSYLAQDGRAIRDKEQLQRIRQLAIPPAYTDVWICPDAQGHLQATGRDARGRKQYRYHAHWQAQRKQAKFDRMLAFGAKLAAIRRAVARDLEQPSPVLDSVVAAIVRLLDETAMRIGNDEYAQANGSYGLTTLRNRHARLRSGQLTLAFKGKSGVMHEARIADRKVARMVRRCQDLPGQRLFQFVDDAGEIRHVRSEHVNAYIQAVTHEDFTAKDFRTWHASVSAMALALQMQRDPPSDPAQRSTAIVRMVKQVAQRIGNTCTVCRKFYIHPEVLAFCEQAPCPLPPRGRRKPGLSAQECAFLDLLGRSPAVA